MLRKEFEALMEESWLEIQKISSTKGSDYSDGVDRLSNFKDNGKALGLSSLQTWGVYASKHWNAVTAYVRNGQVESEPIDSRIHDMILYLLLLRGLIEDIDKGE